MSDELVIRQYDKRDKAAVLSLLRLNTPKYFDTSEEAELISYLKSELEDYYVVCVGKELIAAGGINYFLENASAYISWDIVHPNYQGKGVGTRLTQYRLAILEQNSNVDSVVVRTSQHAHGFYAKQGFRLTRHTPDYWAKGFDLYYMEMSLAGK